MTVQSMNPAGGRRPARRPARARSRLGLCRTRTARCDADFLDGLVDAELELVRRLPTHLRVRPVEMLAVLAMLAQDYRHYARGRINRRELRHCAQRAVHNLDAMRCQLTALDLTR